jgi:hypothetical protein
MNKDAAMTKPELPDALFPCGWKISGLSNDFSLGRLL